MSDMLQDTRQPPDGASICRVVLSDITARKQAEKEKEMLQAQLRQAQKMESVGRLAGGVAHDFNNMLGVILGHTEMALARVDPAQPIFADLQEIRKAAERSADLTRQLLAFARKQTIAPRVIDLNEIVEGILQMLRRLIGEDIDLRWQPGRNLRPVKVDPSQLDQLLANLCVNARDAIAGVGKITIETDTVVFDEAYCADHAGFVPGEYVLLAVSDNGCGMDIVLTGSNSRMLASEIATSLRGRTLTRELFPLSFGEYLRFKAGFPEEAGMAGASQRKSASRSFAGNGVGFRAG